MPEMYKYFMTVSPLDGKLYLSDYHRRQILRVKTMGAVRDLMSNFEIVAGTGKQCTPGDRQHCGDGGLATEAKLYYPKGEHDKCQVKLQEECLRLNKILFTCIHPFFLTSNFKGHIT